MQALEVVKHLTGVGDSLAGRLLLFDGRSMHWREVEVPRNPGCPVCGDAPTLTELIDYAHFCGVEADGRTPRAGRAGYHSEASDAGDVAASPGAGVPGTAAGSRTVRRSITAAILAAELTADDPPLLVDVREGWEWDAGNLGPRGAVHVPLAELPTRLQELPRDRRLVVVCSVGARSAGAASYLRERGFEGAVNLEGGLEAWAEQVDPTLDVV
jgi:adenylyltransferase/sulfurtransferase